MPGASTEAGEGTVFPETEGTSSYDVGVRKETHIRHCYGISNRGSFVSQLARSYLVSKCPLGFLGKFLTWVNENTYLGLRRQFNYKMTAVQA